MDHFVKPDTRTIVLDDGNTITVRRQLNAGEQRALYARMYLAGVDGSLRVNPLQIGIAVVTAYLVGWSLRDGDGSIVEIRGMSVDELTPIVDNLMPDTFGEIRNAIERHVEHEESARIEEKKALAPSHE